MFDEVGVVRVNIRGRRRIGVGRRVQSIGLDEDFQFRKIRHLSHSTGLLAGFRAAFPGWVRDNLLVFMNTVRIAFCLCVLAALPAFAQNPVDANKKVVFDFYRLVFEPRNTALVEKYIAEDFIEHNPRYQSGRENFVKLLRSLPPSAEGDIGPELQDPPAFIIAEKDLVTYIFKRTVADPQNKGKSYERFSFDTFRIKDGKIVEHWDGASK